MENYNYCRILQGEEARKQMIAGVDQLANLVKSTLGPNGRTVAMEQNDSAPSITQDGVSVARSIKLGHPVRNMGAQLVKQVANKAQQDSGDGTTTATVIAQAILKNFKELDKAANVSVVKEGMRQAVNDVVEELKKFTHPVTNKKEDLILIDHIANISSNGDREITDAVVDAIKAVGDKGAIRIDIGKSNKTEIMQVAGMTFSNGLMSPYMAKKKATQSVSFEKARIFVTDHNIKSLMPLQSILTSVENNKEPLLIICDGIDNDALFYFLKNINDYDFNFAAVKAPGFGSQQAGNLEDIAIATGAIPILKTQYPEITELLEMEVEDILGIADVNANMHQFSLENWQGDENAVEAQKELIRSQMDEEEDGFMRDKLSERMARLTDGICVIYAGANSETEAKEKQDRIDDAVNAVKAATAEGVVPGGGTALLKISKMLAEKKRTLYSGDFALGYISVLQACQVPFMQIIKNAYLDHDQIGKRIMVESDVFDYGFDVKKKEYCNLFKKGIIDPLKVVKNALLNAESVASTIVSTSGVVYYVNDKMEEDGISTIPNFGE